MNWLRDTTQAYRRGYAEGEAGEENAYLLKAGLNNVADVAEYNRGFEAGWQSYLESLDEETE